MSLIDVLKKRKRKKEMETDNIRDFIFNNVKELTEKKFNESFDKLKSEVDSEIKRQTDLVLNTLKNVKDGKDGKGGKSIKGKDGKSIKGDKGDKGDTPTKTFLSSLIKPLIPKPKIGRKGDKGDSIKGDKGDSGKLDKPKDIVKKLNILENVLDVKVLKGLQPILKTIQDSIRATKGGGGGQSNMQHESFPVDSSTTSVTVTQKISANGLAIFAFYNGQMLPRNVSYTVSGKTLNLTFTPDDGTFVDVIYFRA